MASHEHTSDTDEDYPSPILPTEESFDYRLIAAELTSIKNEAKLNTSRHNARLSKIELDLLDLSPSLSEIELALSDLRSGLLDIKKRLSFTDYREARLEVLTVRSFLSFLNLVSLR